MEEPNFKIESYKNNGLVIEKVKRLFDKTTFTLGDYVGNNTPMKGNIIRFEPSPSFDDVYVVTDWSGVGMALKDIMHIKRNEEKLEKKKVQGVDFGMALNFLKKGKRVQRKGWNGKDMFLKFIEGDEWRIPNVNVSNVGQIIPLCSFVGLKTADDKFIPWLPSQQDMIAEDWQVI